MIWRKTSPLAGQLLQLSKVVGGAASAFLKWLDLRAKALVGEHWPAIERLANALLKRGVLREDEIAALMK